MRCLLRASRPRSAEVGVALEICVARQWHPLSRMVRDYGIKMLPAADNACIGASLRHLNVIGIGLSKTGTTAAALALSRAGLKVAHNLNDLLSDHCEAIFNTLEANYELLDRKHPRARWLVTHSGDSRKWLASVQQHQQQDTIMRQSTSGFLSCRYFGCSKGMPNDKHQNATLWSRSHIRINTSTARVLPQDEARLIDAYELYYKRLFAFLRGRDYAYVDVRRGIYVGLQALHPNVSIQVPFASANQALGGGHLDWAAMAPKEGRCYWRHGCLSNPALVNHSLDWPSQKPQSQAPPPQNLQSQAPPPCECGWTSSEECRIRLLMCARLEDQHSLITTARVHGECACASRCCKGLASRQIIGMGLSKTGTTATVFALEKVGLRVAHDRGDQIGGQCQAILNTLEDSYECLDRAYPTASWVITYTANVSSWVASLQSHLAREPYTQRIANRSYLACRVFGCSKGVPTSYASDPRKLIRVNPHTNRVVREDEGALADAYSRYYSRLFAYLGSRNRSYALVDVRAGRYDRVHELIHEGIRVPFEQTKSKQYDSSSGGGSGRCYNPRAFFRSRPHGACHPVTACCGDVP